PPPVRPGRRPACETPPDHADRHGGTVPRGRPGRPHDTALSRARGGVVFVRLQGRLRGVLQEEPGSLQVSDAAATLPRGLHPQQALIRPVRVRRPLLGRGASTRPLRNVHLLCFLRKAMTSLRSCGSLRPANAILVPGMKASGFSKYLDSTSSVHTRPLLPADLLASE